MRYLKNVAIFIIFIVIFVVGVKLSGWSPLNLILGPQYEAKKKQTQKLPNLWWLSEFKDLVRAIDRSKNTSLSTSYMAGPNGQDEVKLSLQKNDKGSLVLTNRLPKKAMSTRDEETGEMKSSKINPIFIIRDHNFDGIPDDYIMEPKDKFIYHGESELTKDGFIKIREVSEDLMILTLWSNAIAYSVNHFLHGINSSLPRSH